MNIVIREYTEADLPDMIRIWNEIVEEGIAFPQEDLLDYDSGESSLRHRLMLVWLWMVKYTKYMDYIYYIQIMLEDVGIYVMPVLLSVQSPGGCI